MTKKSSRNQKLYKMKGCSKKTRKNYLGGSSLAYTGKPFLKEGPNPFLAYNGKGGSSCGLIKAANLRVNTNAANPLYPNTGPISKGTDTIFNNASGQVGGGCGCGLSLMSGGKKRRGGCGAACAMGMMIGGERHRNDCRCRECKKLRGGMRGGSHGTRIPEAIPNGLVGTPWTPNVKSWPGVNGIPGDSNYYSTNQYNVDPQTAMIDVGANPPFLYMKAGNKKKQKGGTLSNFLGQDLINLGRQFQFGMGTAYNALAGYPSPVNPLPWKDQFHTSTPINPATI